MGKKREKALINRAHRLNLNRRNGQKLGVVADDGLPFLAFQEEIELLDEGLRARVGVDDIYGAQERIVRRGYIILEGAHVESIGAALAADFHNAHGEFLK